MTVMSRPKTHSLQFDWGKVVLDSLGYQVTVVGSDVGRDGRWVRREQRRLSYLGSRGRR